MVRTLRCQMCGKENPDDLEFCQFCQALLKSPEQSSADPRKSEAENHAAQSAGDMPLHPAELPDWLQDLRRRDAEQEPKQAASLSENTPAEQSFEDGAPAGPQMPEWLLESEAGLAPEMEEEPPPAAVNNQPLFPSAETPAAEQANFGAGPTQGPSPSPSSDWLPPADAPGSPADQAPEPRQKPRATDVPGPPQPAELTESIGPLAGLHGLLAADAGARRSHYPATRPTKLRISANQLIHIDLLREMLDQEGKAQPLPSRRVISTDHLVRWAIALILLAAVLWSVLYPGQPAQLPLYQEEAAELNRLIEQLPKSAHILVAFDYEPASSAEMDTAAYAVLDHLMLRGAALTLVSTSATGPLLAERFMQRLWPVHQYAEDEQYTNLGYVPGGPAGLASLGRNLSGTLPYTINGVFAWESSEGPGKPPLQGIRTITDYPLILVLVDDVDVARAWVEQLQPYLSGPAAKTSLTMVTSAQVEPIVWPYYDANPRQVHGFVSGVRGGASYARLSGREDTPGRYWNSYGIGLFVAALLILVGGLFYVTYPMLARPPKPAGKAAP